MPESTEMKKLHKSVQAQIIPQIKKETLSEMKCSIKIKNTANICFKIEKNRVFLRKPRFSPRPFQKRTSCEEKTHGVLSILNN